jgi:hypothetical protein
VLPGEKNRAKRGNLPLKDNFTTLKHVLARLLDLLASIAFLKHYLVLPPVGCAGTSAYHALSSSLSFAVVEVTGERHLSTHDIVQHFFASRPRYSFTGIFSYTHRTIMVHIEILISKLIDMYNDELVADAWREMFQR